MAPDQRDDATHNGPDRPEGEQHQPGNGDQDLQEDLLEFIKREDLRAERLLAESLVLARMWQDILETIATSQFRTQDLYLNQHYLNTVAFLQSSCKLLRGIYDIDLEFHPICQEILADGPEILETQWDPRLRTETVRFVARIQQEMHRLGDCREAMERAREELGGAWEAVSSACADHRKEMERAFDSVMKYVRRQMAEAAPETAGSSEAPPRRSIPTQPVGSSSVTLDELVTLNQVAPLTGKSKRTLERYLKEDALPAPDVFGGGGKAHKWYWRNLRARLQAMVNRELPERFPGSRII